MSKQRPTSDKLANELLGASAFFRPAPQAHEQSDNPSQADPLVSPPDNPESQTVPDVTTSRRHSVTTSAKPTAPDGFDINRPTASRDSLRLSIDETRAIDDLRQTLKWDYDVTVSKNDICRAALHQLLEEFAAKADKSGAVNRLKRKQSSR